MKHIKHIIMTALLLTGSMLLPSCTDYQDEIDALDYRVTVLENLVKTINNNLDAMKVVVEAIETGDYITGVRESDDGYVINFKKNGPIHIIDGVDGLDGKDAQSPDITIAKDPTDGQWYWMLNGEWLMADDGQRIRSNGKDGKDAVSPQVRINSETGIWEISIDGGSTWESTGTNATGADGKDGKNGKDGADGKDGKDGKDGNQFILRVYKEESNTGAFMVIETKGGTYKIPIYENA